jgi:hypothetical protein
MTVYLKVNDEFKTSGAIYVKTNGAWARVKEGWVKVDGTWRKFFVSEVKDYFDRADSSTLGTGPTGQSWVVGRGVWNIASNKAFTATSKGTYPLAYVEAGVTDFSLKANELTPGMGVAFRVEDANNWWAVVPWYNRTSYSYTECPVALEPQTYCISPVYSNRLVCPTGYRTVQNCVDGACILWNPYYACGCAVDETCGYKVTKGACYTEYRTSDKCENKCVKYGQRCVWPGIPYAPSYRECTTVCLDKDIVCTTVVTPVQVCDPDTYDYVCTCPQTQYCRECGLYETNCTSTTVCDSEEVIESYQSGCNATGVRYICPTAEVTRTGYNYFYKAYLIQSLNGTVTVKSEFDVAQNFTAIGIEGNGTNFLINIFSDNAYQNQIKSFTYANVDSVFGTKYGLVGYPSNYAEGQTVGSIEVKQLGA